MKRTVLLVAALLLPTLPALAAPSRPMTSTSPGHATEAQATWKEIQDAMGMVPTFMRALPDEAITGAWQQMRDVQMNPNTALTAKYKELIGLAVAAQIPCKYCVYFHTEAARSHGASERELKEAVAIAASSRQWSTIFNGMQVDEPTFRAEVGKMVDHVKQRMAKGPSGMPADTKIATAQDAYRDMEQHLGLVPTFAKRMPPEAVVGAWKEVKALDLNPNTALPGKVKDLISLAVSAQTPCHYCTFMDTQFATELDGASEREVREAVAMASIVRHWSTVLNGSQADEAKFKREVDQIFARARKVQMTRPAAPSSPRPPQ
jgi:AhpD family alkylhydroperoxidase